LADGAPCDLLLVYGSLRAAVGHPMHEVLADSATRLGRATVRARLYDLGAYPGIVPAVHDDDRVIGELYRLADPATTLRTLDVYEGCGPADTPPYEFARRITPVTPVAGDADAPGPPGRPADVDAWVYWYHGPLDGARRIAGGDYCARM
jgi:gamma-glutamylcyclotransferase (GGCT)/AIG2-like uncharacterized protein YtfP